jgi:hypothetical protein
VVVVAGHLFVPLVAAHALQLHELALTEGTACTNKTTSENKPNTFKVTTDQCKSKLFHKNINIQFDFLYPTPEQPNTFKTPQHPNKHSN